MFGRFIISALALIPVLVLLRIPVILPGKIFIKAAITALMFIGYNFLYFKGTYIGFAGTGGVLVTTLNPIFTFGLVAIFSHKRLSSFEFIGLALGLTGGLIILKIWVSDWVLLLSSGNIYFLLGAFSWAVLTIFVSKGPKGSSPLAFIFWMYLLAAVLMLPFKPIPETLNFFNYDGLFWLNFILVSLGAMTFGTSVFLYTSTKLGPEKTSAFVFTVPLSAMLTSMIFLNEPFDFFVILGGCISIGAVYLINNNR